MKKALVYLLFFITVSEINGQSYWTWSELSPIPEPVTNNAVTLAMKGGVPHVYSFMGIDSTKIWSGIHKRSFRYNTITDSWDTIPPVPDNLSRIAASASTVNNKIYIIGGYHVYQNGVEESSKNIFIYDPDANAYSQGVDLLVSTDDHVQCVWRDSLIYIITGWNNTGNIPNVQIYDPANDTMLAGTPVPNNDDYKAFGASGVIIGDTIYYAGGVNDSWVFTIQPRLRIGVINASSPDSITWSFSSDSAVNIYRSAAVVFNDEPIWIGGASSSYNYDGIEYGTGNGVNPLDNIVHYQASGSLFATYNSIGLNIMDLRGAAQMGANKYIIAGGMGPGQVVSNRTYMIEYVVSPGVSEGDHYIIDLHLFPNPANTSVEITSSLKSESSPWYVYNSIGELITFGLLRQGSSKINTQEFSPGIYLLTVVTSAGKAEKKFIVTR